MGWLLKGITRQDPGQGVVAIVGSTIVVVVVVVAGKVMNAAKAAPTQTSSVVGCHGWIVHYAP